LLNIFSPANAVSLAAAEAKVGLQDNIRIGGFGLASVAVVCGMLVMYGVHGLLDLKRLWRLLIVAVAIALGTYSGFRSMLMLCLAPIVVLFFMEGLYRTRTAFAIAGAAALVGALLVIFAPELPLPIQRAISFLPVEVDPLVRQDAQNSVDWRVEMWRSLLPEVPQYWFMGKGYLMEAQALTLGFESSVRGLGSRWEAAAVAGDFHNGLLSLVIPLGGLGLAAFAWFLIAGGRVLFLNYRHGQEELKTINRFFLAYFLVRITHFIFVFGSFYQDLFIFTGLVGMSLSLNGGVSRPKRSAEEPVMNQEGLAWSDY
jgi:O-antigen ligase